MSLNLLASMLLVFSMCACLKAPTLVPSNFLEYTTKTDLRLPFDNEWYVIQGGRTIEENYHASVSVVRFAYDFVIVKDYATHSGDGTANTDYYCYGTPLFAPGAGTIVEMVNERPDMIPGQMDTEFPKGNHIVIDHGNGEISLMAHFQQSSISVAVGDKVVAGQKVGHCGNSGNSSEPHLHFHMQNEFDEGLPAQFQNYVADSEHVTRGEPVKGQYVQNQKE